MSLYLDASVLVAVFMQESSTARANAFLRSSGQVLVVSDFAAAEFASALARRVRMGELLAGRARIAFANFDAWTPRATQRVQSSAVDVRAAEAFIRRLDLSLRTPDAINIAIAQRLGATLATLDRRMAADAERLGLSSPTL